uniref:Uncharacterized protein n=1 Tax=Peronospora matthiolae TaxID=2874970 RepID=A0AAV1TDA9_9STRA
MLYQRSTELSSAIHTNKETFHAVKGRDQRKEEIYDERLIATDEIRHEEAYPLHSRSVHQPETIAIIKGEFQEQTDGLVEGDTFEGDGVVEIKSPAEDKITMRSTMVIDAIEAGKEAVGLENDQCRCDTT